MAAVFDVETQNLAKEIGGWANIEAMRVSVACSWSDTDGYQIWHEAQAPNLVSYLESAEMIVGFNINSFDYRVLSAYTDVSKLVEKTYDILDEINAQGLRGISLDRLALLNLNEAKVYGGVDAVRLWRAGDIETLEQKCQKDVELTQRLFEMWENEGLLRTSATTYAVWPNILIGEKE